MVRRDAARTRNKKDRAMTTKNLRLDGKVVVVTGSTRGIGRAIVERFGRAGAKVVVSSSTATAVTQATQDLAAQGLAVLGVPCDVSERKQIENLRERTLAEWGQIDIWINNAGISGPFGYTLDVPPTDFERVMRVNLLGCYHGSTLALEHMLTRRSGQILNLSGGGAKRAQRFLNAYSTSKAAIVRFSQGLARDYQDHPYLAINVLTPGIVATDMTDFSGAKAIGAATKALEQLPKVLRIFGTTAEETAELALKIVAPQQKLVSGRVFEVMPRQRALWRLARAALRGDRLG